MGINARDAAPVLFIPYWSTLREETLLVLNSAVDAYVITQFFDETGKTVQIMDWNLLADEHLTLDLSSIGLRGEGSIMVRSKPASGGRVPPSIAAETIIRGGAKDEIFSFSPAIAAEPANTGIFNERVWTDFAQAWYGSFGSIEDELFIFSPKGDLAVLLDKFGILPGRPEDGYPDSVVVEIYDNAGSLLTSQEVKLNSVTRVELQNIPDVRWIGYTGPGTIRIQPVLIDPDCRFPTDCLPLPPPAMPEDVEFISYLKRHLFNEVKADKDTVKSGYLFSVKPEKR